MSGGLAHWQALVLAAIQGATEFLPVSSSGHLVLARRLFNWSDEGGLIFDTVLHAGSLAAILIYFWRDWVSILRAYHAKPEVAGFAIQNPESKIDAATVSYFRRLPWMIALATLPATIAGPLLKPALESEAVIRNPAMTGLSMVATALLFALAERRRRPDAGRPLGFLDALFVGCMQVVSLLPGASRSGWTAAGGLLRGLTREEAVRFAFFMAVPAIAGAIALQAGDILQGSLEGASPALMLSGFMVSFASSLGAVHFCLRYFRSRSFMPFAFYLLAVGILSMALA